MISKVYFIVENNAKVNQYSIPVGYKRFQYTRRIIQYQDSSTLCAYDCIETNSKYRCFQGDCVTLYKQVSKVRDSISRIKLSYHLTSPQYRKKTTAQAKT